MIFSNAKSKYLIECVKRMSIRHKRSHLHYVYIHIEINCGSTKATQDNEICITIYAYTVRICNIVHALLNIDDSIITFHSVFGIDISHFTFHISYCISLA